MKHLLFFMLLSLCYAFMPNSELPKGVIIIEFDQIKANKGIIEVSLYNDDKTFLQNGSAFFTKRQKVVNGKVQVVFDDIPFGDYAAVSYHDVNENNKFDRNFLGIPKEPVAVSKLEKKRFSKPCFNEAKVDFNQSKMVLKMKFVKY